MSCRKRRAQSARATRHHRLGNRLYKWRLRHNLSQSEAALKLNMSARTLQEWEQGRAKPRHTSRSQLWNGSLADKCRACRSIVLGRIRESRISLLRSIPQREEFAIKYILRPATACELFDS